MSAVLNYTHGRGLSAWPLWLGSEEPEEISTMAPHPQTHPPLDLDAVEADTRSALAAASSAGSFQFKVLTVNIHKGFTIFNRKFILPELREALRVSGADVVFLQEVTGWHATHPDKYDNYPETPHYEFLAAEIWPQFAYGKNAIYTQGDHGNAILSKFPISRFENIDISMGGPERRGLLHCELRIPGRELDVHAVCAHLGLLESHRARQLAVLASLVKERVPPSAPVVVAGDFNDWRCRAQRFLLERTDLREVFTQTNGRPARTFPASLPVLRLDRIYVRNAIAHEPVVMPYKPWAALSDHAPLAAEIEL